MRDKDEISKQDNTLVNYYSNCYMHDCNYMERHYMKNKMHAMRTCSYCGTRM